MTLSPFDVSAAVVCITGGGSGIGLGLAEKFLEAGSTVIITGRRDSALKAAQERLPKLHVFQHNAADAAERSKLVAWLIETHPRINVLVSNAGIMRRKKAGSAPEDWTEKQQEIAINLEAPIHLMQLLTSHLLKQPEVKQGQLKVSWVCSLYDHADQCAFWQIVTGSFHQSLLWACICPTNLCSCV